MGIKKHFTIKMILLLAAVLFLIIVILYALKRGNLSIAEVIRLGLAGICCGFLIFATFQTALHCFSG
ncbi:MAG: hypothetical protein LUD18_03570 [Lachnospiraceae bacterium]|nr:hypothetical protein [Lachnospiraceae bacterium]